MDPPSSVQALCHSDGPKIPSVSEDTTPARYSGEVGCVYNVEHAVFWKAARLPSFAMLITS